MVKLPRPGKLLRKARTVAPDVANDAADDVASKVLAGTVPGSATTGISPNPMTNAVIADIALRSGGQLLRRAVEVGLLGKALGSGTARNVVKGRSMGQTLLGTAIARVATRSVPGALIVGGGLLAKALYERRHARDEAAKGNAALRERAAKGRKQDK